MQAADGSFPFHSRRGSAPWSPCGALFATAYVMLSGGRGLPRDVAARAVHYLRGQRRPDGLWHYDPALSVPPDSDSTACALAALRLHECPLDAAADAALLRRFWRPGAGPFRTWDAGGMWALQERDEPVANCNIVYALGLLDAPATAAELDSVHGLLRRSIEGPRYYCAPSTIAHAAQRAGLNRSELPAAAVARPPAGDLMGSVQWLCAMPAGDPAIAEAVLAAQRPDGSWPIANWVTAVGRPTPYWGSPALTTAFAIEALGGTSSGGKAA